VVWGDAAERAAALVELDKLERMVTALPGDDHARQEIGIRLQSLLLKCAGGEIGTTVDGRISGSTADEIFDFIDNELGVN
jgi:hypothetical protein